MTAEALRGYHFANAAQWDACLFVRADRGSPGARDGLHPIAPYEPAAHRYAARGAHAPAVTRTGEVLWHDNAGLLYRLPVGEDEPETSPAPFAIGRASRLLSTSSGLWVAGDSPGSLQRFEEDTLTRLSAVEIQGARIVDIASDAHDAVFALIERNGVWQAIRINCAGRIVETVTFEGISHATAFVFLRRFKRFAVLAGDRHPRLYWFAVQGGAALFSIPIAAIRPCFTASALGSDSYGRVFVTGADSETLGGEAYVVIFDGDGNTLSEVPLDARDSPATGIAGSHDSLLATGPRGLLRFPTALTVPDRTGEVRCVLVTPMLHSPDREDTRRWSRIEASASLPQGATLEISYAATDDPTVRDRFAAIAADSTLPASHRAQRILVEPGVWQTPVAFHGSDEQSADSTAPLSAPLFDVHERYLWVCITLIAAAGARLPALGKLAVLYPGHTLMENLPAVYRRAEAKPGSFLRALVGVLESTTQGLDQRIAALGSHVHPATATPPWLDFTARWLGLPWDDALSDEKKKCIVAHARELANSRGTRFGLETLLECLIPGKPRRFRVIDATADFGFATVGGDACRGSALPALLGGRKQPRAELDSCAVLGRIRLPYPGELDDGVGELAGHVRVDIAVSAEERHAWQPWLHALINGMVPLTARVHLLWVSARALRGDRLDGSLTLEATPTPHLGTDALTGVARLPERGSRLTSTGVDVGTRLH